MGVRVTIGELDYEIKPYTITEESTPTAITDSTGSVGSTTFDIVRPDPDVKVAVQTPLLVEDLNNPGFLMEVST